MRDTLLVVALNIIFVILLVFSSVRYKQGEAEGYNNGYRQALKEFRIANIEEK